MSRKFLLVSKPAYKNYQIPYLWTTAKTYYEQHGKYSSEWEWADPLIEHEGWEEALDHIIEQNDNDEATIRLSLPRHVIASRLSITPETLSRLIRNMTDEGLISVDDRIVFVHRLADLKLYD